MRTSKRNFGRASTLALSLLATPLVANNVSAQETNPDSTEIHTRAKNGGFFGLGFTQNGANLTAGLSFDISKNPNLDLDYSGFSIMPYGRFHIPFGNQTETSIEFEQRERERIGKGTYRTITGSISTETDTRHSYELGVEASKGFRNLEAYMGLGFARKTERVDRYGTSTIEIERNGEILDSGTIKNELPTTEKKDFDTSFLFGLRRRIFNHVYVGAFYNRLGKENRVGASFRFTGNRGHR